MSKSSQRILRRRARLSAVQALYQMDLTGQGVKAAIREFQDHRFGHRDEQGYTEVDEEFFMELMEGAVREQSQIDPEITDRLADGWRLSRIDKTLRAILRCGAFELIHRVDVPAVVVIDEYVTLTSNFFDEKDVKFANAALESIAKDKRASEFAASV